MNDDKPPDDKRPVRHTDLSAVEGDPSPEAEHAYQLQRSDLEFERSPEKITVRMKFAGPGLSPINVALAQAMNLAGAGGAGVLAHYLNASTGWVIGLAIGSWAAGTGLTVGAMRLMRTKRSEKK